MTNKHDEVMVIHDVVKNTYKAEVWLKENESATPDHVEGEFTSGEDAHNAGNRWISQKRMSTHTPEPLVDDQDGVGHVPHPGLKDFSDKELLDECDYRGLLPKAQYPQYLHSQRTQQGK